MAKRVYKSETEEIAALKKEIKRLKTGLREVLEMLPYRFVTAETHCRKVLGILGNPPTKKEREAAEDLKNSWAVRGGANSKWKNWNPGESTLFR